MSFRMVWANFTNPSLHLLEQPLMVAAGRQALLSMPRREGFRSARPWPLEPAWASPERGRHPGRSWNSTAASAGSPASASREPAGHAVGSLPLSFPPLKSYPREDLGMPGLGQRCQGTGRSQGGACSGAELGGALELSQALLAVFLTGSGNRAINTPVRREGTATPKHAVPQLPSWLSRLLLPASSNRSIFWCLDRELGELPTGAGSRCWAPRGEFAGSLSVTWRLTDKSGGMGGSARARLSAASGCLLLQVPPLESAAPHQLPPCRAGESLCAPIRIGEECDQCPS